MISHFRRQELAYRCRDQPTLFEGKVEVELTDNGLDWTRDGVVFEYVQLGLISLWPQSGPIHGRAARGRTGLAA